MSFPGAGLQKLRCFKVGNFVEKELKARFSTTKPICFGRSSEKKKNKAISLGDYFRHSELNNLILCVLYGHKMRWFKFRGNAAVQSGGVLLR